MLKMNQILDEKNPKLRMENKIVTFPLKDEEKEMIKDMLKYLRDSQTEEIAKKYELRAGMGLAGPQVSINKRFFVICHEFKDKEFNDYVIINPKLLSHSEELIYAETGEGCLSVNRDIDGIIPRYARVTVEAYDIDGNKINIRAREELAIAFQHELDHLEGILFFDRIDKKDPFKNSENMRAI